jgi:hypothetical protein
MYIKDLQRGQATINQIKNNKIWKEVWVVL